MNTTTQQDTQAAANKAAEEGGLPIPLEAISRMVNEAIEAASKNGANSISMPDDYVAVAHFVCCPEQYIAADRASRQVANKAEVEPSDSYKAGYADGMDEGAKLAFWGDKPSEKFPEGWPSEIWLNAGDDELGPFSEYDELSWCSAPQGESDVRYIREDLLATPPATTGASTAPRGECEHCHTRRPLHLTNCQVAIKGMAEGKPKEAPEPLRQLLIDFSNNTYFCGLHLDDDAKYAGFLEKAKDAEQAIIELFQPVGASTVLTDEWASAIVEQARLAVDAHCDSLSMEPSKEYSDACLYHAIAREVAAQAGQVAVPTVLVSDVKEAMRLAEKGHGSKWINYDGNKLAAVLEDLIGATPSPAKESK